MLEFEFMASSPSTVINIGAARICCLNDSLRLANTALGEYFLGWFIRQIAEVEW